MATTTTLCFDFGNTRLKCAIYEEDVLQKVISLADDRDETILELIRKYKPDRSLLSSVVHHNEGMERLLAEHTRFHLLSHQSNMPLSTAVPRPETIGADRLALCVAARQLFPSSHNLIVGLGTAITYNFVNKEGVFLGGGISPGMEIRFRSLHNFTAKLPLVERDWNFPLIGYDTRTNILSGVLLGMAKEIDGMIDAYNERYGNLNVLLTGGDSAYFAYHIKNKIFADPNLIFKGLYVISELNNA